MSSLNYLIDALYLSIFIIVILFGFIILIVVHFFSAKIIYRNKINGAIYTAEENERKRIAMELHDSLGNILLATKLKLNALSFQNNISQIKQDLIQTSEQLNEALQIIRITSHTLIPEVLMHYDLKTALNELISKNASDIVIRFKFDVNLKIPQTLELNIYRIVSELFTNSIKYSNAEIIELSVSIKNKNLILFFSDNGIGFDFESILSKTQGIGLINIKNRIDFLNGELKFKNKNGVCFIIKIPINVKK